MVQMVRKAVHEAEPLLPPKGDYYLPQYLSAMSEALNGIDDHAALQFAERAWKECRNDVQRGSALGLISAIDHTRAHRLLVEIKDPQWHEFAVAHELTHNAFRQPWLAAQETHYDGDAAGTTQTLCKIRPELGARFLNLCHVSDRTNAIESVAMSLEPQEAKSFLSALGPYGVNTSFRTWIAAHPDASGPEFEKAARLMPTRRDRIELILCAIKAYSRSAPERAMTLADRLCDAALDSGGKPIEHNRRFGWDVDWDLILLPEVARIDSAKVREYLESLPPDRFVMSKAAAWSYIDISRASVLAEELLAKDAGAAYQPHRNGVSGLYECYLMNLAKSDPKAAISKLLALEFVSKGTPKEYGLYDKGCAMKILSNLWREYPREARIFCNAPTYWFKDFGKNPSQIVDLLQLNASVLKNPIRNVNGLRRLYQAPPVMGLGPESIAKPISIVAAKDQNAAIRISRVATAPYDRVTALLTAFDRCKALPYSRRSKLLQTAFAIAKTDKDKDSRIVEMLRIAKQAHLAWQRLQPWPPKA